MVRCEFKFALEFLALSLLAAVNLFASEIDPFVFSGPTNDAQQEAYWDDLMKYKLWGTGKGAYGVEFISQEIYITDTNGYVGSGRGGFKMGNIKHSIGGPLAFKGDFVFGDGTDEILSGPSRFGGKFNIGDNPYNTNSLIFRGKYCVDGDKSRMDKGLARGNGSLDCNDPSIPDIDEHLDVPTVNPSLAKYSLELSSWSAAENTDNFIDIPPGEGMYDIHITGDFNITSNKSDCRTCKCRLRYGTCRSSCSRKLSLCTCKSRLRNRTLWSTRSRNISFSTSKCSRKSIWHSNITSYKSCSSTSKGRLRNSSTRNTRNRNTSFSTSKTCTRRKLRSYTNLSCY